MHVERMGMQPKSTKTALCWEMLSVSLGKLFHGIIEVTLQKMLKDKKDDPDKKIPMNFEKFVTSPEFRALLESMLDYCRELFRLENKQTVLE